MSQVAVLMSTYNGEKYLPEQLDSILAQRGERPSIYVRDDGSGDTTLEILQSRTDAGELQFEAGDNMGPAKSFLNLLFSAPDHEFYAFADQDDVWLPGKLERALERLDDMKPHNPRLYFSNVTNADADGKPTGELLSTGTPPGLGNAMVQCFSIGATMVFNHAARSLLVSRAMPMHVHMHDWWAYLVVASLGQVIYDPEPSMLYRQHGQNVYGSVGHVEYFRRNWRAVWQSEKMKQGREQARDLLAMYQSELPDVTREQLEIFTAEDLGFRSISSALKAPVYKQQAAGTVIAKLQLAACCF